MSGDALRSSIPSGYDAEMVKVIDQGGNSVLLTAGLIIADVVGAGILSMATAIADYGWALGSVVLVVLLTMNVHISMLLWRVRMGCPESRTLMQLAAGAFANSSQEERTFACSFIGIVQYTFIFALLGVYTLSFGKGLAMLMYNIHVCLPVWAFIGCCIIWPVHAVARTLGHWSSLVVLNVATIVGTIAIPLLVLAAEGVQNSRPADSHFYAVADPFTFRGALRGANIMTFAFTSQFMLIEIIAEMKEPAEFPKAYVQIAAPFQLAAFLIVGVGGYYLVGDQVTGMIGDNIAFGFWFRVAAACLLVHMIITFMIKSIVICRAIHNKYDPEGADDDSPHAWSVWSIIVAVMVAASWLASQIVPFFTDFVDLLGASLTPIGCYIIPIYLYRRWLRDFGSQDDQIGNVEWAIICLELVFSICMIIFGTWEAVTQIYASWETYGYPFSCHCENTWNTCECSAGHVGMEQCQLQ